VWCAQARRAACDGSLIRFDGNAACCSPNKLEPIGTRSSAGDARAAQPAVHEDHLPAPEYCEGLFATARSAATHSGFCRNRMQLAQPMKETVMKKIRKAIRCVLSGRNKGRRGAVIQVLADGRVVWRAEM